MTCSRIDARRAGALFGALLAELVLFKLVKLVVLTEGGKVACAVSSEQLVTTLFVQHALPPLLLVLLGIAAVRWMKRGSAGVRVSFAPLYLLWSIGTIAMLQESVAHDAVWLSWSFAEFVRQDVLVVAAAASVAMLAIARAPTALRRVMIGATYLVVLGAMLLAAVEFAYFVMTGSLGDLYLLRYSLRSAGNLSYLFSHELQGGKLVLALLPVAVVAGVAWWVGRAPARGRSSAPWRLALIAVVLALLPHAAMPEAAVPLASNLYASLVVELVSGSDDGFGDLEREAEAAQPIFDAANLRLVDGPTPRRMNVIYLLLESQRSPSTLPMGTAPTPFLDELMARSLVVERMYAVVPHTTKAMVPILCGVPPRIDQADDPHLPARCLPALLGDRGYASAFFASSSLEFENEATLLGNMGFGQVFSDTALEGSGHQRLNYFGYEDAAVVPSVLTWIDQQRSAARPFMLAWLTLASHHPYALPEHWARRSFVADDPDFDSYLNALAYVDGRLAELFEALASRRLLDDTIVVLVGDHGEAFGEHQQRYHSGVIWDEALTVPAVIHSPRLIPGGRVVTGPRQQIDLLPTVAALLGLRVDGGVLPGQSLLDPVPADRRLFHAAWIENQAMAMRVGTRKFVYRFRRQPLQMFDTATDPGERHDLAPTLAPEELQAAERDLLLWRRRVNRRYD